MGDDDILAASQPANGIGLRSAVTRHIRSVV
jgi:hypothetical protein